MTTRQRARWALREWPWALLAALVWIIAKGDLMHHRYRIFTEAYR